MDRRAASIGLGAVLATVPPRERGDAQLLQRENDPVAVAAFVDGLVDTTPTFSRLETPTLCYEGTSEVFFDLAEATAQELGAAFVAIDGLGHNEAFQRLDAVAPTVREFFSRSTAAHADR